MSDKPVVSVIMPVFNACKYLKQAIDSILTQTYRDFEFIIIDDCSTDKSLEIVRGYTDPRIKLIENPVNRGIADSLNKGIANARGAFIARMDADDISLPERLAKQVAFLMQHPEIGICGTAIKKIGGWFPQTIYFPQQHEAIYCTMILFCPFAHPTIMLRRDLINRYNLRYNKTYKAEDYELHRHLLSKTKGANLPDVLLQYRVHKKQLTLLHANEISHDSNEIRRDVAGKLGFTLTYYDIDRLSRLVDRGTPKSVRDLEDVVALLKKIQSQNDQTKLYDPKVFGRFLAQAWLGACKASSQLGLNALKMYYKYRHQFQSNHSKLHQLHLFYLCIMKV